MELHIFRTNISSKKKVNSIGDCLKAHDKVIKWNVDLQDIDNVLRIEAQNSASEGDFIQLVKAKGFQIEALPD